MFINKIKKIFNSNEVQKGKGCQNKSSGKYCLNEQTIKKMNETENNIIETYALAFIKCINRIQRVKDNNFKNNENFKLAEELYFTFPELIHYRFKTGENMIQYFDRSKMLRLVLDIIKECDFKEICIAKNEEVEPLCFSLIESRNMFVLDEINQFIKHKLISVKDANGVKWSQVYDEAIKQIVENEDKLYNDFAKEAEQVRNKVKYRNRGLEL